MTKINNDLDIGSIVNNLQSSLSSKSAVRHSNEDEETCNMSIAEMEYQTRMIEDEIKIMRSDVQLIRHESEMQRKKIEENEKRIELNTGLPLLAANVIEILGENNMNDEDMTEGDVVDAELVNNTKSIVIKTSTRETVCLPNNGLLRSGDLQPGDLVSVNKESFVLVGKLPDEHDSKVRRMEIEERPMDCYADIAGCDTQIQELIEAVVLPMTHRDMFTTIGIQPPKGVLLHGPPGTGKTLLARACANQTNATFFKIAGPEVVQTYIGDGARLIRDVFALAKEKIESGSTKGAIIFIDEIDAIGVTRHGGDENGEREVQRTMLELLSQMDGFSPIEMIKVIAATNRADILDPALLRSGRLDRKIELPMPSEDARVKILKIHSHKANCSKDVVFDELSRSSEGFSGAMLKAVCIEAGMLALRKEATEVVHEDFVEAIAIVATKKKGALDYFA